MGILKEIWHWIGDNKDPLGVVIPIILAVGGGIWAYLGGWFSKKQKAESEANQTAISITPDQLAHIVKELVAKEASTHDPDGATDAEIEASIEGAVKAVVEIEDVPPSQMRLALKALEEGRTDNAEKLFEMVLEKENLPDKHRANAAMNLGALKYLHDTESAVKAYERAVQLNPDEFNAINQLGHLYRRLGRIDDAIAQYRIIERMGVDRDDPTLER